MKTIKSFLFVMFMLLASNVMANLVFDESREPGLTVTETDKMLFQFADTGYDRSVAGYVGRTYVVQFLGGADIFDTSYTFDWSIEGGDRSYIWPTAGGRKANASVYYSNSGTARVVVDVYKSGEWVGTLTDYMLL